MVATTLSRQEQRIVAAARRSGEVAESWRIEFDWRQAAGLSPDEGATLLTGLRRYGYAGAIGPSRARLTEEGVEAAAQIRSSFARDEAPASSRASFSKIVKTQSPEAGRARRRVRGLLRLHKDGR